MGTLASGATSFDIALRRDDHWIAIGDTGIGQLVGDAADSPITEQELQPSLFFALGYAF